MKLTCDICNGDLEIVAGGKGAVCKSCGLAYSVERLKEKLGSQSAAKPVEDEVIYDVKTWEVLDESNSSATSSQTPVENNGTANGGLFPPPPEFKLWGHNTKFSKCPFCGKRFRVTLPVGVDHTYLTCPNPNCRAQLEVKFV